MERYWYANGTDANGMLTVWWIWKHALMKTNLNPSIGWSSLVAGKRPARIHVHASCLQDYDKNSKVSRTNPKKQRETLRIRCDTSNKKKTKTCSKFVRQSIKRRPQIDQTSIKHQLTSKKTKTRSKVGLQRLPGGFPEGSGSKHIWCQGGQGSQKR